MLCWQSGILHRNVAFALRNAAPTGHFSISKPLANTEQNSTATRDFSGKNDGISYVLPIFSGCGRSQFHSPTEAIATQLWEMFHSLSCRLGIFDPPSRYCITVKNVDNFLVFSDPSNLGRAPLRICNTWLHMTAALATLQQKWRVYWLLRYVSASKRAAISDAICDFVGLPLFLTAFLGLSL